MSSVDSAVGSQRSRSWAERNWGWIVAGGVIVFFACVFFLLNLMMGLMRASDPFQTALARVRSEPAVTQALGAPIDPKFFSPEKFTSAADPARPSLKSPCGPRRRTAPFTWKRASPLESGPFKLWWCRSTQPESELTS